MQLPSPRCLTAIVTVLAAAIPLRAQDSLAWEPVGDRPIKPRDIAFDSDGALWSASAGSVFYLDAPDDPDAEWELRREWSYDLVQPLGPDTLLVTTGSATYRSTDGGYTFTQTHNGGEQEQAGQTLAEDERGRLYVATHDGAARSLDRGNSWADADFDVAQTSHWGWAVLPLPDSLAPGRVLVGGLGGVSVARDADADWTLYPTEFWEGYRYGIESLILVKGPSGDARIVATGADQTLPHRRVWVSDDLGETWAERGPLPDVPDGGVGGLGAVFALGGRSAVAVLGRGNVYRTDDGAETWALVGRAPVDTTIVHAKAVTVGPDGRLYVGISRLGPDYDRAWVYRTTEPLVVPTAAEPEAPEQPGDGPGLEVVPNPSRGSAAVTLTLPRPSEVEVAVYDALGRRVAILSSGYYDAGHHAL
ncbi:MAG TPA: hypothetical protein VK002_11540, partial [Rubricoccaceae bacterium]|nr:hypothetical protein [Rubricoccaceae bacterium]